MKPKRIPLSLEELILKKKVEEEELSKVFIFFIIIN